jgi:hypothetical protein
MWQSNSSRPEICALLGYYAAEAWNQGHRPIVLYEFGLLFVQIFFSIYEALLFITKNRELFWQGCTQVQEFKAPSSLANPQ